MKFTEVVGPPPNAPNPFGIHLNAADEQTDHPVPHRVLSDGASRPGEFVAVMRQWLITHHASREVLERNRRRVEAMVRQGFANPPNQAGRFPTNPNTQKGNWAEILLAEYLGSSCNAKLWP